LTISIYVFGEKRVKERGKKMKMQKKRAVLERRSQVYRMKPSTNSLEDSISMSAFTSQELPRIRVIPTKMVSFTRHGRNS